MTISAKLMQKLTEFPLKVHALAFEHQSEENTILPANEAEGFWLMFGRGGEKTVCTIHLATKEMFLETLAPEEKEELDAILAAAS